MEPKGSELADEERRARAAGVGSKRDHQHWFAECVRLALVASASAHNAAEDSQRPPKKRARLQSVETGYGTPPASESQYKHLQEKRLQVLSLPGLPRAVGLMPT